MFVSMRDKAIIYARGSSFYVYKFFTQAPIQAIIVETVSQ